MKNFSRFLLLFSAVLFVGLNCSWAQSKGYIENKGQWDNDIVAQFQFPNGVAWFYEDRVVLPLVADDLMADAIHETHDHPGEDYFVNGHAYEMRFGTAVEPEIGINGRHKDYINYYLGNDRSKWATRVGIYDQLWFYEIQQGIDLLWEMQEGQMKYTLVVDPASNPEDAFIEYGAVRTMSIDAEGRLQIELPNMDVHEERPVAFQEINGRRVEVECAFKLEGTTISFVVGDYDPNRKLFIDPVVVGSTNVGSAVTTYGHSATFDQFGNIYGGGRPFGVGYPTDTGSFQMNYGGGSVDIGISKLDDDASDLLWSSYIGGSDQEYVHSIVVNGFNDVIVYGKTRSTDFPTSITAFDTSYNGNWDICLTVLSDSGDSLIGSTYLGGDANDGSNVVPASYGSFKGEVVCDIYSNVFIASSSNSTDFPVSSAAYQPTLGGTQDGVVSRLNYNLSVLEYSTYLGDTLNDVAFNVKPSKDGTVYVVGSTQNEDFPTSAGAHDVTYNHGSYDAYITRFNAQLSAILQSTFVQADSGSIDNGLFLQLDRDGDVYILGTSNGLTSPTSGMPGDTNRYNGPQDDDRSFIRKYTHNLDSLYWTVNFATLSHSAFLVDNCKNIYVGGNGASGSGQYELTSDAVQASPGGFYVMVLNPEADSLIHGTYYGTTGSHVDGGTSRFDKRGAVYQATCTNGYAFPQTTNAWSGNQNGGSYDLTLFKIDFEVQAAVANAQVAPNSVGCVPLTVDFSNFGSLGLSHFWDFGDGDTANVPTPSHTFTEPGQYEVKYVIYDTIGCVLYDTAYLVITVLDTEDIEILVDSAICANEAFLSNTSPFSQYTWSTGDQTQNIIVHESGEYWLEVTNVCGTFSDTVDVVIIPPYEFELPPDTGICEPGFLLSGPSDALHYQWNTGDTTQTTQVNSTGEYILIASSEFCSDTDTVNIDISFINFTSSDTVVCDDSLDLEINAAGGNIVWSTSDTTEQITVFNPGVYWATVSNGFCSTTDTITVAFNPTLVNLGPDIIVCQSTPFSVYDSTLISYLWSTGDTTPNVVINESMTLWVIGFNGICADTDTIVIERQRLNFEVTDELVCDEDSHVVSAPGPVGSSFLWSTGDTTRTTQISGSGSYIVTVSTEACTQSDTIDVTFANSPEFSVGEDAVICSGEGYDLEVNPVYGDVHWNNGDTGRVLTITQPGMYIASMSLNGCEATDTVMVRKRSLDLDSFFLVPNVITPNDDGLNDNLGLKMVDPDLVTDYSLIVYNRWGTLVFESEFLNHNWDGRLPGGDPCREGVYYYVFTGKTVCTDIPVIEVKDHVTVLR